MGSWLRLRNNGTSDRRRTENTTDKCVDLEIGNESEFCDPGPYEE